MEVESSNFCFNSQFEQASEPKLIAFSTSSNESLIQQGHLNDTFISIYPKDEQNYNVMKPYIVQSFSEEAKTINEEQDMLLDFQEVYPSGFPEINQEVMSFINLHVKKEKTRHATNPTSNALLSTGHTDGPHTIDLDDETPQTTSGKRAQNENRNNPMLITMGAVRSLRSLLKDNLENVPSHWQYLCDVLENSGFTKEHIPSFLEFLKSLKSAKKTWEGVREMLQGKGDYGMLLLKCVDGLLSEEGQDDFNNWLSNGLLKEKGRNALISHKSANREYFSNHISRFLY